MLKVLIPPLKEIRTIKFNFFGWSFMQKLQKMCFLVPSKNTRNARAHNKKIDVEIRHENENTRQARQIYFLNVPKTGMMPCAFTWNTMRKFMC